MKTFIDLLPTSRTKTLPKPAAAQGYVKPFVAGPTYVKFLANNDYRIPLKRDVGLVVTFLRARYFSSQ